MAAQSLRILLARPAHLFLLGLLGICLAPVEAAPLEDILVTARKREENLQDVPIAITAVSGEQMRRNNIGTLEALAPTVPNLSFSQSVSGSDLPASVICTAMSSGTRLPSCGTLMSNGTVPRLNL